MVRFEPVTKSGGKPMRREELGEWPAGEEYPTEYRQLYNSLLEILRRALKGTAYQLANHDDIKAFNFMERVAANPFPSQDFFDCKIYPNGVLLTFKIVIRATNLAELKQGVERAQKVHNLFAALEAEEVRGNVCDTIFTYQVIVSHDLVGDTVSAVRTALGF